MEKLPWQETAITTTPISASVVDDPLQALSSPHSELDHRASQLRNNNGPKIGNYNGNSASTGVDNNTTAGDTKDSTGSGVKQRTTAAGTDPPSSYTMTQQQQDYTNHPQSHMDDFGHDGDYTGAKEEDSYEEVRAKTGTNGSGRIGRSNEAKSRRPLPNGRSIDGTDHHSLDSDTESNVIHTNPAPLSSSAVSPYTATTTKTTPTPPTMDSSIAMAAPTTSPNTTLEAAAIADTESRPVTAAKRAVQDGPVEQRHIPRRTSRARTISSPSQSRHEYLTDMDPLEMERKVDLNKLLLTQKRLSLATSAPRAISSFGGIAAAENSVPPSPPPFRQLLHHPTSSSPVSETSHSSRSTTDASSIPITGRVDQLAEAEGMAWNGGHPLLMDYTTEPEILDDRDNKAHGTVSSHHSDRISNVRHKGHSMGMDTQHRSATVNEGDDSVFASGQGTRRRRNVSRAHDDGSWTSSTQLDKDMGHSRTVTEPAQKRVIIHQVAPTDTLAGIALYYGIQVPILKKSNKLWTNDSIHTRKYLYIPFEECTVTQQEGVMVDENNHTVVLPQRVHRQQYHSRSGSILGHGQASNFTISRTSSNDASKTNNSSLPNSNTNDYSHQTNNLLPTNESSLESGSQSGSRLGAASSSSLRISPPPISAIIAGMLPLSSSSAFSAAEAASQSTISSPRVGNWTDSKSLAVPPINSPTTLKSDNSLGTAPLSSRCTSSGGGNFTTSATSSVELSENLPNTVMVSPSMTHEALAARFKEMDLVSGEQRKSLNQQQELRTNPVHHHHRTTDLRQYANMQQYQQKQRLLDPESSNPSSNAGSRRGSVDVGIHDVTLINGVGGHIGNSVRIEEEDVHDQDYLHRDKDQNDFVEFGHHQYIYDADELEHESRDGSTGGLEHQRDGSVETTTLRLQELVTVPAAMLSFFPSPEYSKRLETPPSISRIQDRIESHYSSSSPVSSSNFRDATQDRNGMGIKSKGRASLDNQTFLPLPPNSSSGASSSTASFSKKQLSLSTTRSTKPSQQRRVSSSSSTSHSPASPTSPTSKAAYSKTVRINQQHYSPQKWSIMGESLVDDLLGAVRGPLQIARRVYNFTTLNLGSAMGSADGSSGNKQSPEYDTPGVVRRKTSTRGRPRSQRNKDYRNSLGSAIELDQAGIHGLSSRDTSGTSSSVAAAAETGAVGVSTGAKRHTSVAKWAPTSFVAEDVVNSEGSVSQVSRKKSGSGSISVGGGGGDGDGAGGGGGHFRVSSADSNHSARKRSLRSSNPINHAALMALVNELDKDKREKEKEERDRDNNINKEQENKKSSGSSASDCRPPSSSSSSSSSPVVDILATSL